MGETLGKYGGKEQNQCGTYEHSERVLGEL